MKIGQSMSTTPAGYAVESAGTYPHTREGAEGKPIRSVDRVSDKTRPRAGAAENVPFKEA